MIEWREEFSFGIEKIDNQHKEFLKRLNGFLSSLKEGKGKEEIEKVFEFLKEYVIFHFEEEETFMKNMDFPDFEKHKKTHQDFKENINKLKEDLDKEGASLSFVLKVSKELTQWYINHIGKMDKKYALAFKGKS
ncbi:MAG: bacteriohemerythrin [Thermoanaerobaculia bacterium]